MQNPRHQEDRETSRTVRGKKRARKASAVTEPSGRARKHGSFCQKGTIFRAGLGARACGESLGLGIERLFSVNSLTHSFNHCL